MGNSTDSGMNEETIQIEGEALRKLIDLLTPLDAPARDKLLKTAATFFEIGQSGTPAALDSGSASPRSPYSYSFSDAPDLSPKEFLTQKQPHTDIERIACLAYYLTHFRSMPIFKTIDLSKLNTEAAQVKFSNPADAANNALKKGLLAPAGSGMKQISAPGEQFVSELPDHMAAKDILKKVRKRRARTARKPKRSTSNK